MHPRGLIIAVLTLILAPGADAEMCAEQPADSAITAFCGVNAPEDMVLFDDRYLIVSSMDRTPHLFGLDLAAQRFAPLKTTFAVLESAANWGDPSCTPPRGLETHGLDLSRRDSGEWQLLAVNHGERESIEFFAVIPNAENVPELRWRGCVLAAPNTQFNDVIGVPGGGFLATDPITASWQFARILMAAAGMDTGRVYRWQRSLGYRAVPHTEGAYPNGILLSAERDSFYLNLYLDGEVREHDLETGVIRNRIDVSKPDNSSLSADGTLLVASHEGSIASLIMAIGTPASQPTTIPYKVVAIDTENFEGRTVYSSTGDALGAGTVAQAVGEDLYIGSFRGDRLLRIRGALGN